METVKHRVKLKLGFSAVILCLNQPFIINVELKLFISVIYVSLDALHCLETLKHPWCPPQTNMELENGILSLDALATLLDFFLVLSNFSYIVVDTGVKYCIYIEYLPMGHTYIPLHHVLQFALYCFITRHLHLLMSASACSLYICVLYKLEKCN